MTRKQELNELFEKYYRYVFKYEVGYEKDFDDYIKRYPWVKDNFVEDLTKKGMAIKVNEGY